jgi:ferredoxin-NADP reductase
MQFNTASLLILIQKPLPMMQAFEKKFLKAKVPAANIHYEEFNFR